MPKVTIDNKVTELSSSPSRKVGDAIRDVVSSLPANRFITQITIDGKVLSTSTDTATLDRLMDNVGELQFRTVDKEIWAATGLDISISSIERVQRSLIHAADLFRSEDRATANHFFIQCIDGLERFFEAILVTQSVLKIDFSKVLVDGIPLLQIQQNFTRILESIVQYQEKQDFGALADKVEYELLTNLSSWTSGLKQLRLSSMSNA